MKAKVKIHTSEQDIIIEGLRKFGRNAYNATLANDVPVTVLQGKIYVELSLMETLRF